MGSGPYQEVELSASSAKTATGQTAAVDVSAQKDLVIYINVTAVAGTTPTLDIVVQDSLDGTTWFDVATIAQIVAAAKKRQLVENIGNFVRLSYTIGGTDTPSFTFKADAVGRN